MYTLKETFAIGGLHEVGYATDQDLLIVLSSQGQGIFDCIKGEKIARVHDDMDWWDNYDEKTGIITGFDVLAGIEITTSGLHSEDKLPKKTADGWTLIITEPEPDEEPFEKYLVQKIHLISPDKEKIYITQDGACELRAFGFSGTGNSFIVATSCTLVIYSRAQI
jgi:hypothetical protein